MATNIVIKQLVSKGELISENVYQKTELYLPFIARLCLLSSLINKFLDVFRTWISDHPQDHYWPFFVLLAAEVGGCALILFQKREFLAFGLIFYSFVIKLILTNSFFQFNVFRYLSHTAIIGSLIILLADCMPSATPLFSGLTDLDSHKPRDYMKLSGRCLVVFMFINFISLDPSFILQEIVGCTLMVFVVLGYKTKLCVLVTVVYLNVINFSENIWWTEAEIDYYHKFKFFQGVTLSGALLMIAVHGPGGISIDQAKKTW